MLKPLGLEYVRSAAGVTTDADLAERMEITLSQLTRVRTGMSALGKRFIAGALLVVGAESFKQVFELVETEVAAS